MKEKYGFVYIWYDRKRKMFYIGSHWGSVDDGYICSSNRMRDAYRRRPNDFKRKILIKINTNKKELLKEEQNWLDKVKNKKKYYNLNFNVVENSWWSDEKNKLKICEKISLSQIGRKLSEEHKEKISKGNKGKIISEKQKKELSEDKKNRVYVSNIEINKTKHVKKEQVNNYLKLGWYIGRLPGWKKGVNNYNFGKTGYWKNKIGPNLGNKHTIESKQKMSNSRKKFLTNKMLEKVNGR